MIQYLKRDNLDWAWEVGQIQGVQAKIVYADMIYEDADLTWMFAYADVLADDGLFIVQTDHHTSLDVQLAFRSLGFSYVNDIITIQEWGGTSKRWFPRKHDTIFIYTPSKNLDYYVDMQKVQIPKKTAGTAFDKKGTGMKTPCDVFYDLGNFSTMDSERIIMPDGHCYKWQKPLKLYERLFTPFVQEGDLILDPFSGVATVPVYCHQHNLNCISMEIDDETYGVGLNRLVEEGADVRTESD